MALHASVHRPLRDKMVLRDGHSLGSDDLNRDGDIFALDDDFSARIVVEESATSVCREPTHSILKSHDPSHEDDGLSMARQESDPMDVPCSGLNRKEFGAMSGSPSLASLGTSPGTGSMADMWRLWAADDDDDSASEFPMVVPPARRSLSLKVKKTPPGTPGRKKMVRFADAMGLDLEKVRHFLQDQIPNTPASALSPGLFDASPIGTITNELNRHATSRYLTPSFPQPCLSTNFLERIRTSKVCLDSVQTQDFAVHGLVRVLNISFEKSVLVRYTFDNWRTSMDLAAQYVCNSHENFSDRFQFTLNAPPYMDLGQTLQFALCYQANGEEFWDSNYGQNYSLTCCAGVAGFNALPPMSPPTNAFL